jgi:hypothetical protein
MKPLHDIRDQMPKFAANFFPPYEYQPYPRMMVDKTNPAKPKPYLDEVGKPKAVHSEAEEAAFWASLAPKSSVPAVEAPKAIEVLVAAPKPVERHQFEAIDPATVNVAPKRRGRPPSVKLPADLK